MKIATVKLRSASALSYSREIKSSVPFLKGEKDDAYEERTWREKAHYDPQTKNCQIPGPAFKFGLDTAAKSLGKIPGKGAATWTKHFLAGVLVIDPADLGIDHTTLPCTRIFANTDGIRGSGKRVWRQFPRVDSWEATVVYTLIDDAITKEVFEQALRHAGAFVGVGQYRPEKGGYCGRYEPISIAWS